MGISGDKMARFKKEVQTEVDPLLEIEERLSHKLNPVQPDPEFVRRVRYKLTNPPSVLLENRANISGIISILVILASGLLILLIINRIREWIFR
jgi:hypothetical protein